ncbi:MAG TPA: ribosomal-processing cysteine protease Prp [Ruminococcaceae bacterium]|nr:ribosomal-processing cysteine protease Prp [Oscillospiraceae bacterium]
MIKADFYRKNGIYCGFIISGHAGGRYGQDIICAGVSSAVMLTVNTVTDFFVADADIKVQENKVGLRLNDPQKDSSARALVFSLENHLRMLSEEYGGISVAVKEIE